MEFNQLYLYQREVENFSRTTPTPEPRSHWRRQKANVWLIARQTLAAGTWYKVNTSWSSFCYLFMNESLHHTASFAFLLTVINCKTVWKSSLKDPRVKKAKINTMVETTLEVKVQDIFLLLFSEVHRDPIVFFHKK